MEAEERPSKMRRLNDDDAEAQASTTQFPGEPEVQPKETDGASSQGEPDDSDADTADSSHGGVAIKAEKAPRPEGMSKNAWKKLQKKADWEAGREYRKAKRKHKIQEKKERARTAKAEARAQSTTLSTTNGNTAKSRIRHKRLPVTFLIDCGFDDLMMEKERISLGSQLTRSYSDNIRAPFQAHLVVSSWGGLLKERFDTVLEKHHENWRGVVFTDKDFEEAAEMAKEAMKGPYGGEMAGIFSWYTSAEQPEIGAQPDLSLRAIEEQTEQSSIAPYESGSVLPANVDSNNHESQAAEPKPAGQIEHGCREDLTSSSPALIASASMEVDPALQKDGKRSLLSNGSPFASGPRSVLSVDHTISSSDECDPDKGEVIYLTSDSPYTLDELKPYSTYIIGGLVDKNRHKGICYKTACEKGLKTAKLPIGEFMEMQSRFVLATNHVVEIMVRWLECGDWGKAFLDVIPKRKGGKLKDTEAPEGLDEHDI
jgi:tRNA (guanine9-N1)-methyltransferase